ncbi:helicase-related protein [Streptomyces sp. BK205]|uniref:helicase-related protein n=1 Tax=Streptomyces sp. BK205 TaxID=2512164 RepID=UPI00104F0B79|nr:helicase-related protein [Streptomyces sp. BK205]TCR15400.1 helicase-like protein [Streptomyces sp. BK205]
MTHTARDAMVRAVRRELCGPCDDDTPMGRSLQTAGGVVSFDTWEAARGPWHDAETKEEILSESEPLRRYGIGILFGKGAQHGHGAGETAELAGVTGLPGNDTLDSGAAAPQLHATRGSEADADDFDLSDANSFQPSVMAISFKARIPAQGSLRIEASAAAYEKVVARVKDARRDRTWWIRRPFQLTAEAGWKELVEQSQQLVTLPHGLDVQIALNPEIQVYSRAVLGGDDPDCRLITVALANATSATGSGAALFQAGFTVSAVNGARIEAYPEAPAPGQTDEEEASTALLYRDRLTFAVGHGCAAGWDETSKPTVNAVRAEPLPYYEVPSLTPDITWRDESGKRQTLRISMEELAKSTESGKQQVERVLKLYRDWIRDRREEIPALQERFQEAALRHMDQCDQALERMCTGWGLVQSDRIASTAFQLANEAMLQQQIRSRLPRRDVTVDNSGFLKIHGAHPEPCPDERTGYWRPFQIAFILSSLPEIVYPQAENRDLVDLIFFPTGGGKTEAYLGAAAVSMIARRLRDPDDAGTDVLMRYTLRLLTTQQFLRAASLICVLEDIRERLERDEPGSLGSTPYSIGIWLGTTSTPNSWDEAKKEWSRLKRDPRAENHFLLLRCPWCGARMGPVGPKNRREISGYVLVGGKVRFRCPDRLCRFGGRKELPIAVVDTDIYTRAPSLVIGTVDKFAMLAWRHEARALFGIDDGGRRVASPPSLIIQDELHLISGPLGSMVGLYEPLIEDLCTDHRVSPPVRPKIIASTATIRRYEKQILDLYGRGRTALFPPHGLSEGRSFFAEPAREPGGGPANGRLYLGILSPSLGSTQTVQVRVAAATLQGGRDLPEGSRDGYWTNLNFLNSLRELGNTVSLLQSDIPDYLTAVRNRDGLDSSAVRWPRNILELTSRRRSDEIPKAIDDLEVEVGADGCIDVCLASNIIEVGVDIERLGLMTIVGQPKTTAQYIQVSGRVGRKWWDTPGLVLTIYGAAKPRDRSHYERFRTYHQRLYAQVEPTSLTPFALPVLQRGLHGALISHIRQTMAAGAPPHPFPHDAFSAARSLLSARAALADEAEEPTLGQVAAQRAREWSSWERTEWSANPIGGNPQQGLMRYPGTLSREERKALIWEVPTSMRSVDAECELRITTAYAEDAATVEDDQ